jgi:hypothetical protein
MSFVSAVKVCRPVDEGYRVTSPYLDLMLDGTSRCKCLGANVNNALSDVCCMKGPQELFWQEIEEHAIHFGTVFEGSCSTAPEIAICCSGSVSALRRFLVFRIFRSAFAKALGPILSVLECADNVKLSLERGQVFGCRLHVAQPDKARSAIEILC